MGALPSLYDRTAKVQTDPPRLGNASEVQPAKLLDGVVMARTETQPTIYYQSEVRAATALAGSPLIVLTESSQRFDK